MQIFDTPRWTRWCVVYKWSKCAEEAKSKTLTFAHLVRVLCLQYNPVAHRKIRTHITHSVRRRKKLKKKIYEANLSNNRSASTTRTVRLNSVWMCALNTYTSTTNEWNSARCVLVDCLDVRVCAWFWSEASWSACIECMCQVGIFTRSAMCLFYCVCANVGNIHVKRDTHSTRTHITITTQVDTMRARSADDETMMMPILF